MIEQYYVTWINWFGFRGVKVFYTKNQADEFIKKRKWFWKNNITLIYKTRIL